MGCGISTMDGDDASTGRRRFNGRVLRHQHALGPPVVKKYYDNIDDDSDDNEGTRKEEGFDGEMSKEKKSMVDRIEDEKIGIINERQEKLEEYNVSNDKKNINCEEEENINDNRDDRFIGPGSPSFREYCNDFDSVDRSSLGDSNDYTESGESTKNSSDEDSTKPRNEKILYSDKKPDKKERRRGLMHVMNKGKARGRRNLLNFACYNSSTQSYAETSFNKIVTKTT